VPSRPKRHHQVPRFYLERFSSAGKVAVARRDGASFDASPLNVAVEAGFYDLSGDAHRRPQFEAMLAMVEGAADSALARLDNSGQPPTTGTDDREALAMFIALQKTRTTDHRERALFPARVAQWAGKRAVTRALLAEYLEREHLGFAPSDREVEAAYVFVAEHLKEPEILTPEFAMETMLAVVQELYPRIQALN
jgi:hypothetical protein